MITKHCKTCGRITKKYPMDVARYKLFFCNRACKGKYTSTLKGEKGLHWTGGRTFTKAGYIQIYQPSHPNASPKGYVYEHRLVMEKKLGRYLDHSEQIHHLNGDKKDNNPDNLIVVDIVNHLRLYHLDNMMKAVAARHI